MTENTQHSGYHHGYCQKCGYKRSIKDGHCDACRPDPQYTIDRLKARLAELYAENMDLEWQASNNEADAVQYRFEKRVMTREEYQRLTREHRQNPAQVRHATIAPEHRASGTFPEYNAPYFFGHLHDITDHVRLLKSTVVHPAEFYTPLSVAYSNRRGEELGDYYGDLYVAELERKASLYHAGYGNPRIVV
jgi:hypothetical protein